MHTSIYVQSILFELYTIPYSKLQYSYLKTCKSLWRSSKKVRGILIDFDLRSDNERKWGSVTY